MKAFRLIPVGTAILLVVLFPWQARGQFPLELSPASGAESLLPVDYAVFAADSGGIVRLELYYQVINRVLQFVKTGESFEAGYEMSVTVTGRRGEQVAASTRKRQVKAVSEQQAMSSVNYRTRQLSFSLPPGEYQVGFMLRDENAATTIRRDFEVKLDSPIRKPPSLSDIELVQFAGEKEQGGESFTKGNLVVVPSVRGDFGGDGGNRLLYYIEIYRGTDLAEQVRVETILRPKGKSMVYRDSATVPLDESTVRQLREVSLSDFSPGEYELEIYLKGRRDKKLDSKRKEFRIDWSAEAALKHDYEAAIAQLEYIASGDEIKKLRNLQTLEERVEAFKRFWRGRDPTPETPENEVKTAFYQRVAIANQRFTVMRRDGWRSDRGRIYIQYGEPDQVDDFPLTAGGRPYQVWHYYRYGPYRRFAFVDEHDDGDFRLQFPYDGLNQRPGY